jgi:hypothetical protein
MAIGIYGRSTFMRAIRRRRSRPPVAQLRPSRHAPRASTNGGVGEQTTVDLRAYLFGGDDVDTRVRFGYADACGAHDGVGVVMVGTP